MKKNYLFTTDSGLKIVKALPSYESACTFTGELKSFYQIHYSQDVHITEPEDVSEELYEERLFTTRDAKLNAIDTRTRPNTTKLVTVIYSDYSNIFFFDVKGLTNGQILGLIEKLISKIQDGANFTRKIVDVIGDTYFVY